MILDFQDQLEVDAIGVAGVKLKMKTPNGSVDVHINPKSFRKAQSTYKENDGNCTVMVTGELDIASLTMEAAGLVVQPRAPKAPAAAGQVTEVAKVEPATQPVPVVEKREPEAISQALEEPKEEPKQVPTGPNSGPIVIVKKKRILEIPHS